jgi:major type 1 subunit fimbrin (pilin)
MKSFNLGRLLARLFCFLAVSLSLAAHAETNCEIPTPVLALPASVSVDDSAPNPSVIGSWFNTQMDITCWKNTYYEWDVYHRLSTNLSPSGMTITDGGVTYTVYATGTTGVGIAIGFQNVDKGNAWETVTPQAAYTTQAATTNQIRKIVMYTNQVGGTYNTTAQFKVAFVKIGTIRSGFSTGSLRIVDYYPVWYGRSTSSSALTYGTKNLQYSNITISSVQFNVVPPSCDITTDSANASVTLQPASVKAFTAIGTTANPKNFNINLVNCYKLPVISMTLSGNANPDYAGAASKGVLASTGGATGVGVQLLNNQTGTPVPIALGTPTGMGTVTGNGQSDSYAISLVAQYIKTTNAMTPGTVSASATFTLTYK